MTDKEKIIKELKEALDSLDITNKYRLNLIRAIEYLQEELVSEDLEEACEQLAENARKHKAETSSPFFSQTDYRQGVMDGAEWQIAKLMKNAIDVTVHIEAGNYPYIPQMELYDYDKDVPLAKEGDKYKVVLIKEE